MCIQTHIAGEVMDKHNTVFVQISSEFCRVRTQLTKSEKARSGLPLYKSFSRLKLYLNIDVANTYETKLLTGTVLTVISSSVS